MNGHARFEQLCALSAAGELDPIAEVQLAEHLLECATCGQLLRSFRALGAHLLVQDKGKSRRNSVPKGMTDRFLTRARAEGIPVSTAKARLEAPTSWKGAVAACLAGLLLVTGISMKQEMRKTSTGFPTVQGGVISTPKKEVLAFSQASGDRRTAKREAAVTRPQVRKNRADKFVGTSQEALPGEWKPPVWHTVSAPPLLGVSRKEARALAWKMPSREEIAAIGKPNYLLLTQVAQRKETSLPSPEFARLVWSEPVMQK